MAGGDAAMTIELPRIIPSFPPGFQSKWSDLPTLVAPPEVVERNAVLEFHVRVDELEARFQSLIDDVVGGLGEWFWPHELDAAGERLVALYDFLDTPLVVGEPVWPSFDVLWEWAGDGELINRMNGAA